MFEKGGFTLAEALITVGILGIVAVLSMPVLTSVYKLKVTEAKLTRFNNTIARAVELSEVDNNSISYWDTINTEIVDDGNGDKTLKITGWAEKYLAPYIKDSTVEYDKINGIAMIQMMDGGVIYIDKGPITYCQYKLPYNATYLYLGTECFAYYLAPRCTSEECTFVKNKGIEPFMYAWDGEEDTLRTDETYGCNKSGGKEYCTQLIRMNNWKIPSDYPLSF